MIKAINHEDPSYVIGKIQDLCSPESMVLEIGCGDGRNLKRLKEFGFCYLEGIDKDGEKIIKAKENLGENAVLRQENILNFSTDRKFDIIFHSLVGIFLSPEEKKILIEKVRAYLNPGGYYIFEEIARNISKLPSNRPPYFYSKKELEGLNKYFTRVSLEEVKRIVDGKEITGGLVYVGRLIAIP